MQRSTRLGVGLLSAGFAATLLLGEPMGLRINLSSSMPVGLYLRTPDPIQRGTIVDGCLPEPIARVGRERGYIGGGACPDGSEPVAKTVAATAGDRVELRKGLVAVNGVAIPNSATERTDREGRELPQYPRGVYTVAPGELWLLSTLNAHSWDSRYYGPIPVENVRSTVRELFTVAGP